MIFGSMVADPRRAESKYQGVLFSGDDGVLSPDSIFRVASIKEGCSKQRHAIVRDPCCIQCKWGDWS